VNHTYNRWWEGRCVWATMTASLLSISASVTAGNIMSPSKARAMLRWSAAYLISLKASLRRDGNVEQIRSGHILLTQEICRLEAEPIEHRPLYCTSQIKKAWGELQESKQIRECASKELEKSMPEMTLGIHSLQRIMTTSMPWSYVVHLRSFLFLWLSLVPIIFVFQMGYYAIGLSVIIGYLLLGMEALSLEIEEPFGRDFNDIPLDSLAKNTLKVLISTCASTLQIPRGIDKTASIPLPRDLSTLHRMTSKRHSSKSDLALDEPPVRMSFRLQALDEDLDLSKERSTACLCNPDPPACHEGDDNV
jgi:predicted membrane chloride channel (bestrophin family)